MSSQIEYFAYENTNTGDKVCYLQRATNLDILPNWRRLPEWEITDVQREKAQADERKRIGELNAIHEATQQRLNAQELNAQHAAEIAANSAPPPRPEFVPPVIRETGPPEGQPGGVLSRNLMKNGITQEEWQAKAEADSLAIHASNTSVLDRMGADQHLTTQELEDKANADSLAIHASNQGVIAANDVPSEPEIPVNIDPVPVPTEVEEDLFSDGERPVKLARPASGASKDDWVKYVVSLGGDPSVAQMTKPEVILVADQAEKDITTAEEAKAEKAEGSGS